MPTDESSPPEAFNPPNDATYGLLMRRRSVKARDMCGPGPNNKTVAKILSAGMRVPDHGKLAPWRFIVLCGSERDQFGTLIADALVAENETSVKAAEKMKGYATQGPVLIIAVFNPAEKSSIPLWEQQLSTGAACQNMLIAATALGYASQWLTGWASYSPGVAAGLGLTAQEKVAGFLFFGDHSGKTLTERPRPDEDTHISWGFPSNA